MVKSKGFFFLYLIRIFMVQPFAKVEYIKMHTHGRLHIQFYRPHKLVCLTEMSQ